MRYWSSKKQSFVATSNTEAEFMAASAAIKEVAWLQSFLQELRCAPWSIKIHCDSQGCIQNLKNPVYSKYTKRIPVQLYFAPEVMKKGHVDIRYVDSAKNHADIMTNSLVGPVFNRHVEAIGLLPLSTM